MVNFPLECLCQPWNSSKNPAIHYAENFVKEFLIRFWICFKFVDFVLRQEVQPFLHLQRQSSNSIFDFNLRASFARLSFQVNKTCWKSPKLNRRILTFCQKNAQNQRAKLIFSKKAKILFDFGLFQQVLLI